MPTQSQILAHKTTLRIPWLYSEQKNIAAINCSPKSFIDDRYFKDYMSEGMSGDSCKNYPVNIFSLRIAWLIKNKNGDGQKFM